MTHEFVRRPALRVPLVVCEHGHALADGPPEDAVQIQCPRCREWAWEDGNFCDHCGIRLRCERCGRLGYTLALSIQREMVCEACMAHLSDPKVQGHITENLERRNVNRMRRG